MNAADPRPTPADAIHRRAREQFGASAAAYATSPIHAAGHDLPALVAAAATALGRDATRDAPLAGLDALDVATGAGHTALALARAGARVIASDLTPEMLTTAERTIAAAAPDLSVATHEARAEALPFENESFDLVACRIAAHHFADPAAFVAEAARVLRPGGLLLLIDNVAPADAELAAIMNEIERRRDPSHVEAYPVARWTAWLDAVGFDPLRLERWSRRKAFRRWLERARTPVEEGAALERRVLALDAAARRYFGVETERGADGAERLEALTHEAILLVAVKR